MNNDRDHASRTGERATVSRSHDAWSGMAGAPFGSHHGGRASISVNTSGVDTAASTVVNTVAEATGPVSTSN